MKWEYLVRGFDNRWIPEEDYLNKLGAKGWELVAVAWQNSGHGKAIFKRPLAEKEERSDT